MDIQTLKNRKYFFETEIRKLKLKEIEKMIKKIDDYPIPIGDKHYQILDEIREDLKKFRINYL